MTVAAILTVILAASCTIPRNYQEGKPFVYKSSVTVLNSDLGVSAKQRLKDGLTNQMDDSLKVRTVLTIGSKRKDRPRKFIPFFYYRLSKPAVFDTMYVERSKTFMAALLNAQGYFSPVIRDSFEVDTVRKQQRVNVRFFVSPGKALRLDSVGYDLSTPELQQLTLSSLDNALLTKGQSYSIQNISNELNRLLTIYRDNGYYKITREDMYAEHDTVVAALIDPGLDPFEQLELLDSLQKKKKDPTITVVFKQRTPKDSSHIRKYNWGNINVYPDKSLIDDTLSLAADSVKLNGYTFFPLSNRFKLPFIARNIYARPGTLFRQSDYYKTINTFTNLGAWQQVDINLNERNDTSDILDADILLFPAKKQSLNIDFETSRNASDVLTTGSFFGIGLNVGIRNKNAFRESISTSNNARFGVELGPNFIQTVQASLAHSIYVPRFIAPFTIPGEKNLISPRTVISANAAYTNRRQFFEVFSVNTSWGYDWSKKNHSWQYIPFNFEYSTFFTLTDSLRTLMDKFPTIRQAFNNGLIMSQVVAYTTGKTKSKRTDFFRARIESSGALFGLIQKLERGDLRRFLKLDLEYKYFIANPRSAWAFRAFGGYGYVYGKTGNVPENNLPFFKAYFAGGPYSMRAWPIRQLGLGSTIAFDTAKTDRFGDIKLEGNVEYRFNIGTFLGIKVKSALFTDIGNIWGKSVDSQLNRLDSAEFKFSRLFTDLAVGAGTSLRFDFDFFLIRLDWAYKIKNPAYANIDGGWFHKLEINSGQFQLGIGYPF